MGGHSAAAEFTDKVPTLTRGTTPSSLGVGMYASTLHCVARLVAHRQHARNIGSNKGRRRAVTKTTFVI